MARAYTGGGYNDWFLPSLDELLELDNNSFLINFFIDMGAEGEMLDGIYWSSTEFLDDSEAYFVEITGAYFFQQKSAPLKVRAVRAF